MDKINFNDALFEVFKSIKKDKLVKLSAEIDKDSHLMELKSAYSKCLEFNIAVNRHRENLDEAFLMVPTLRGIVDDLICLKYNMRFKSDDQIKYMTLIREINFLDSLIAQRNFFAENNPFQAVVGGGQAVQDLMERRASCSDRIREFYLSHGLPSRRPNVKEMASTVGLSTIYSYIYFAASNFVHFNPYALLRLGWGPKGEPFQFSVAHFGGYYRDLSAFCGALLYLAFARSFRFLLDMAADHQVACDKLEQILLAAPRWPELITFEELNLEHQYQESIFRRALLGKTAGENGHYVFVGILNEIKSLP